MSLRHAVLGLVLSAVATGFSFGQSDFFMSFDALHNGATNTSTLAEFNSGDSGSIFVYYTTNGPANSNIDTGAFLDVFTSQNGVIRFTSARTLDFDVVLFGSVLSKRWVDFVGETAILSDEFINELGAFRILSGFGIVESNNGSAGLLDLGYDAAADAFLFARIDFTVTGPAGTSVDIFMNAGSGGIVNQGMTVPATFGLATITVANQLVLGDLTGDGIVSSADVGPFVQAIINGSFLEVADINGDGAVNLRDIHPFVALLMP